MIKYFVKMKIFRRENISHTLYYVVDIMLLKNFTKYFYFSIKNGMRITIFFFGKKEVDLYYFVTILVLYELKFLNEKKNKHFQQQQQKK